MTKEALSKLIAYRAVTGSTEGEHRMQPNGGGLFMFNVGMRGIAERPFAG